MSTNVSESQKNLTPPPSPAEPPSPEGPGPTDEDILRLRSRLDREFAVVTQKLADAEETILEIEVTLRTYEGGVKARPAVQASQGKGTEKITARLKAVGEGISRFKDWMAKPLSKEKKDDEAPPSESGSSPAEAAKLPAKTFRDLEDRLEDVLRDMAAGIREKERQATEVDRRLHEAQKELIRQRANEQHVREMQLRIGQTKQLSEDLERKMAMLDEMVRTFESSMKSDTGFRTKPKEQPAALPKLEDRLQGAIDEALKAVASQEKKVAEVEQELERAHAGLVEERARQQRVRTLQVRLRQTRHFSTDVQRTLGGLAASIEDLRGRAEALLRPEKKPTGTGEKPAVKPAAPAAAATAPKPPGS